MKTEDMTRAVFAKLVEKVGGKEAAANAMNVSVGTVGHALTGEPTVFLSLRPLLELQRAAGVLEPVKQQAPGTDGRTTVFLTVEDFATIKPMRFSEVEDGFQRNVSLDHVAEIENKIRSGFSKFPPISVGGLPDGTLLLLDGQHRMQAHINAGIGCYAHLYEVKDLDEARQLYLLWNGRSRKPTSKEAYAASRNPVAQTLKKAEEKYQLTFEQVRGLFFGLVGRGVDFIEPSATIAREMSTRAEVVLHAWSSDPRWANERSKVFSSPRLLQALGHFARDFAPENLKRVLGEVLRRRDGFRSDSGWAKALRKGGARPLARGLLEYVVPRLEGGVTGRRANRVRAC